MRKALHRKLFHLDAGREFEPQQTDDDRLHERVVEVALDVLARWDEWTAMDSMSPFRPTMHDVRRQSVEQASRAARRLKITPVFVDAPR